MHTPLNKGDESLREHEQHFTSRFVCLQTFCVVITVIIAQFTVAAAPHIPFDAFPRTRHFATIPNYLSHILVGK